MKMQTGCAKQLSVLAYITAACLLLLSCGKIQAGAEAAGPMTPAVEAVSAGDAPAPRPPDVTAGGERPAAYRAQESLSELFERVIPSVVVILTEERKPSRERLGQEDVENSIGTGFIVSEDGLIMTASHVIEVVDRIIVRFQDGWEEEARVVAADPRADVALIQLENVPDNVRVADMGNSDQVEIGDRVFVVGSPYGIEFTLTAGHISGRRSQNVFSSQVAPIVQLQTDAAINQGNSGGPMFNMAGQVVGVVSHILTQSGGFEGLGFAVSINSAEEILLNQTAFWSGVEFYPVAGPLALALNVPQGTGLLVQRVAYNAPAQGLGIQPGMIPVKVGDEEFFIGGDVVVRINGMDVNPADVEQMYKIRQSVNHIPKGGQIKVKVIRAGKALSLSTTK